MPNTNTRKRTCKTCGEMFWAKRFNGNKFQIICVDCKTESLCWTCVNATPKRCLWVKNYTPVWDKATEKHMETVTVRKVIECRKYKAEVIQREAVT